MTMSLLHRSCAVVALLIAFGVPGVSTAAAPTHAAAHASYPSTTLHIGRFGAVTVYQPAGPPKSVVLFLSGDGGWNEGVVDMAIHLVEEGAIVAGLDTPHYLAALGAAAPSCVSLAADFEILSHQLQKELKLRDYLLPILVGYSSGATLVYATLVQSPPGTFAGGLSLGFCADQDMHGAKLCPAAGLEYTNNAHGDAVFAPSAHLKDPWIAFQGQKDEVCPAPAVDAFVARTARAEVVRLPLVGHGFSVERNWVTQFRSAYRALLAHAAPPPAVAPDVGDLPIVEIPVPPAAASAANTASTQPEFALLLTGDGGWAGLDQDVSAELATKGLPVVGFNTLRYFWKARTPDETTRDVVRVLRYYLETWNKQRIVLVGYSFGADVLPFIVSRLPEDLRARVTSLNLIGLSDSAAFEIGVGEWLPGSSSAGLPVLPELAKEHALPITCFYGEGESDSVCPRLTGARVLRVGAGHHLSGRYGEIADDILASR